MAAGDAKPVPVKAVAFRVTFPILDADGDLVAGATGLDSEFSEDAVGFADCASEATQIATSSGMYYLDIASTEIDGDTCAYIIKSTEGKTTPIVLYPQSAANPINVNVQAISLDSAAADNAEAFFDGTGYAGTNNVIPTVTTTGTATAVTTVNGLAANVITAASMNADASAEIADAVWDELRSGHVTVGSYGQIMAGLALTGEVNDAGATTTVFIVDGFTEATAAHFNGSVIVFTSGACAGQSRTIIDYSLTTQSITLGEALTDAPADNDDFIIIPGQVAGADLAKVLRLFITILDQATGQVDAGSFAAGAIDANALAAGAVDEIWDEAMTESGGIPAVTASFRDAFRWMFALSRNKITQTATTQSLRNDADAGNIATSTVSDDGTTATRGEWV